jgi:putative acetyltransferase
MILRALEPDDLDALRALASTPSCTEALDLPPSPPRELFAEWLGTGRGTRVALGAFAGARLLAAAGMLAFDRPRRRHVGQLWVALPEGEEQAGEALLVALRDLGHDWWALHRLELLVPAESALARMVPRAGFTAEVVRRGDLDHPGGRRDSVLFAWVRPGSFPAAPAPTFPRRATSPGPSPIAIRQLRAGDLEAHARVLRDPGVIRGTLQSPFIPVAFWRARIAANPPEQTRSLVAVSGEELIASGGLHRMPGPRRAGAWVLGMSVADAWQGRGVGWALLQGLVAEADAMRIPRVELDVYVDNTRAIALYARAGFVVEGIKRLEAFRAGAYVDAQVMSRIRKGS